MRSRSRAGTGGFKVWLAGSFASAVGQDAEPGSGVPLFQAAAASLNPWTEAKVDTRNPDRGPLLIIDAELDNTVPWPSPTPPSRGRSATPGVTEIVKIPGRGHSLTIDHGWREVADTALAFVQMHAQP